MNDNFKIMVSYCFDLSDLDLLFILKDDSRDCGGAMRRSARGEVEPLTDQTLYAELKEQFREPVHKQIGPRCPTDRNRVRGSGPCGSSGIPAQRKPIHAAGRSGESSGGSRPPRF